MYIIMIGAYLNRYFLPVNRILVGTGKESGKESREEQERNA